MNPTVPLVPDPLRPSLGALVDREVIGSAEIAVTRSLTDADTPDEVSLALALTVLALRMGHSCLDLDDADDLIDAALRTDRSGEVVAPGAAGGIDTADGPHAPSVPALPEPAGWAAVLAGSGLVEVDEGGELEFRRPLVLRDRRVWLARYAFYEQQLADLLRTRASADAGSFTPEAVEAAVDRAFDTSVPEEQQRAAIVSALRHRLAFITGGPGTGKTWTVGRLVAAARNLGIGVDDIAIAAPTGKAADRLREALTGDEAIPTATIQRLLRLHRGYTGRPGERRIPHRLVIVDEASMIDLPLMARLVGAVGDDAHLVLVGDPDQLVSVEVGSVLRDVVEAAEDPASPLAAVRTRLGVVRRQEHDSPILPLAEAIRAGDAESALALLRGGSDAVQLVSADDRASIEAIEAEVIGAAASMIASAEDGDLDGAFSAANGTRVLTATRRGPGGRADWSRRIRTGVGFRDGEWRVGRPVMVTRNDLATGLSNGDTGIAIADRTRSGGMVVGFRIGGEIRPFAPVTLADFEDWWAMTIHKSQGSEYGHAVISLPGHRSPLMSRELLYTAVTRARDRVTIIGSPAAVAEAIETPIARGSGLLDRLAPR